jgi:hypothetical protein
MVAEAAQIQELLLEQNPPGFQRLASILLDDGSTVEIDAPLVRHASLLRLQRKDTQELISTSLTNLNQWQPGDKVSYIEAGYQTSGSPVTYQILYNERSKLGLIIKDHHDTNWIIQAFYGNLLVLQSVKDPSQQKAWLISKDQLAEEEISGWLVGDSISYKKHLSLEHLATSTKLQVFKPNYFKSLYEGYHLKKLYRKIQYISQPSSEGELLIQLDNGSTWKLKADDSDDWVIDDELFLEQTPFNLHDSVPYALVNLRSLKLASAELVSIGEMSDIDCVSEIEPFKYTPSSDDYMRFVIGSEIWLSKAEGFDRALLKIGSFIMMAVDENLEYTILNLSELLQKPGLYHIKTGFGCLLEDYPGGLSLSKPVRVIKQ